MAEKKERIYLFTDKFICENCKDWYEHIDPLDSPNCTECAPADFPYITRQEAIERMAKEIFTLRFAPLEIKGKCWDDLNGWQKGNCLRIAEAALNALLEGK